MRLKWDNLGKGLEAVAGAYSQGKINKENKQLWAKASEEAKQSGGLRNIDDQDTANAQQFVDTLKPGGTDVSVNGETLGLAQKALADEEAKRTPQQKAMDPTGLSINDGKVARTITTPKQTASEIYASKYAPRMMEMLIERGDEEKATKLGEWAKKTTNGKALDELGQAWSQMKTNPMLAAQHLMKFYNSPAMPDGMFSTVNQGADGKMTVRRYTNDGKFVDEFTDDAATLVPKMIGYAAGPDGVLKHVLEGQAADSAQARAIELERVKQEKPEKMTPTEMEKLHDYMRRLEMRRAAAKTPEEKGRILSEITDLQTKIDAPEETAALKQLALAISQQSADRQNKEFGLKLSDRVSEAEKERKAQETHDAKIAEANKIRARTHQGYDGALFSVEGKTPTDDQRAVYKYWFENLSK
jgi:hypothetical protein